MRFTVRMALPVTEIGQDEILTGEAVALDVQPLGFVLRGAGVAIDVLCGIVLAIVVFVVVGSLLLNGALDPAVAPILSIVVLVLITVVLPTLMETATHGRSLGKLIVGGRVVRADGGAAGFRQALIRALVGVLEIWLTFGALAAIVGAFTPRAERLGDLLAGTYSERTRVPRRPSPGPGMPPALAGWAAIADVTRLPAGLARRCAQFVLGATTLEPASRARLAASLAGELAAFVHPLPATDAESFVRAVVAVRRDRELTALRAEDARVRALLPR
jgi:uncharacterized RDD family membrane protein YckC